MSWGCDSSLPLSLLYKWGPQELSGTHTRALSVCVLQSVNPYRTDGEVSGSSLWAASPSCVTWGKHFMSLSCGFLLSRVRGPTGSHASFAGLRWAPEREYSASHQARHPTGGPWPGSVSVAVAAVLGLY